MPRILVALVLLVMAHAASAAEAPAAAERNALIERVLTLAGATTQLAQVPAQVSAQLQLRQGEFSSEAFGRIIARLTEAFREEALHASLAQAFARVYDRRRLEPIAAWLASPLVQRLTALEEAAMQPDAAAAQEAFFSRPGAAPPSEARVALLQRLMRATYATEMTLRVIRTTMAGIATAVNAALDRPAPSPAELAEAESDLESARSQIEDRILARLLFTYRDVTDDDLSAYITFWESDTGQWFNRVSSDGYLEAIQEGVTRMAAGTPR